MNDLVRVVRLYANVTLIDGEWIKGEHTFTVDKGINGYVNILFGIGWHSSNISGAMYIDESNDFGRNHFDGNAA